MSCEVFFLLFRATVYAVVSCIKHCSSDRGAEFKENNESFVFAQSVGALLSQIKMKITRKIRMKSQKHINHEIVLWYSVLHRHRDTRNNHCLKAMTVQSPWWWPVTEAKGL